MSSLQTENFSYTDQRGDPLELDLLLSSNVPLETLSEECPELADVLTTSPCDDEEVDSAAATPAYAAAASKAAITAYPDSIFARLVEYGLLKKVTDIVLAKVKIPWNLREDAAQSMHMKWCLIQAKPQFVRNQLAFYAYRSGQHAALALRRDLGAVCVLPGALFREGKESVFMETIGAAVNPMDIDEYKDSMELSIDEDDHMRLAKVDDDLLSRRLGALTLSPKQKAVARMVLVERMDAGDIATDLGMRVIYVERLIKQVTQKLNNLDAGIVEPEAPRLKKAAAKPVVRKVAAPQVERVKTPLGNTSLLRRRTPRVERLGATL